MPDNIDTKLVDRRVVSRYLRKNRLDEKEYEKYLKSLPDLAEQAVPIESALEDDFEDDELVAAPDQVPGTAVEAAAAEEPKQP